MLFSGAGELFQNIYIFTWDALLALVNVVTPNKKLGTVVPHGLPGAGEVAGVCCAEGGRQ
jgi:hypothetical protein